MKFLTKLIDDIAHSHSEKHVISHLTEYFRSDAPDEDKDQALKLMLDQYPPRAITVSKLKDLASDLTGFPSWLIDRSEKETGYFIKTLSLLSRPKIKQNRKYALSSVVQKITDLKGAPVDLITTFISEVMMMSDATQLMVVLKLLTGTFQLQIAKKDIIRALAQVIGISFEIASLRLFELERKKFIGLDNLKIPVADEINLIPPKFSPINLLNVPVEQLGEPWKWKAFGIRKGVRVCLVKYGQTTHLWTIDHAIISDKFTEIIAEIKGLSGSFAIFGQLVPGNNISSVDEIVSRMNNKSISKKEKIQKPVQFEIWSVSEPGTVHVLPIYTVKQNIFFTRLSFDFTEWEQLKSHYNSCRALGLSGLMIETENEYGPRFFWESANHQINAMLMYVESGNMHGSGIESMTLGLADSGGLVPIAKINARDCDIDLHEIAEYARIHTLDRFGPVRTVAPGLVYELQFHSIAKSSRRKSGFLLSGVKIIRKSPTDHNQPDALELLHKLQRW